MRQSKPWCSTVYAARSSKVTQSQQVSDLPIQRLQVVHQPLALHSQGFFAPNRGEAVLFHGEEFTFPPCTYTAETCSHLQNSPQYGITCQGKIGILLPPAVTLEQAKTCKVFPGDRPRVNVQMPKSVAEWLASLHSDLPSQGQRVKAVCGASAQKVNQ